jgi:ubiquinone/menaquinone biosynthesis C-methylase UbiE
MTEVMPSDVHSGSTQALFIDSWQIYRKMVDNDYLFHAGAYGCLRRVIQAEFGQPFRFLDVACGDAAMSVRALNGTAVFHYVGLDISEQALAIAAQNVKALGCTASLHACDFANALPNWKEPADLVWIGLSLHHLQTEAKLDAMHAIRSIVGDGGRLMIYEDASPDGESRDGWLARWDQQKPNWTAYTEAEWNYVTAHVHSSDFPETDQVWRQLGRDAGFSRADELYQSPTALFRLYSFQS